MKAKMYKGEIAAYVLLPSAFIFHLVILITKYRNVNFGSFALIVLSDVLLTIMIYYFFISWQKHKTRELVKHLTDALAEQGADIDANLKILNVDAEYALFYDELIKITDGIRERDSSRQKTLEIVNSVAMNMEFDKMLEDLLPKLNDVTGSTCCAFYMANHFTNKLEIKHSIGFSKNIYSEFDMSIGEGFVGMAANSKEIKVMNDIPDDTVYLVRTILGKIKPRSLMAAPIINQDKLLGVLVFVNIRNYNEAEISMVELIKNYVGVAVSNGMVYERTKRLTSELKFQNKLIQDMNEELEKKVMDRTLYLNNIIDSIKDYAIYAMDKNGILLTWNEGAEILFGYKKGDVIGRHVGTLYEKDEAETVQRRIEQALREGKYVESGLRTNKDGVKYYYELTLFCMYNESNEVIGLSNITRDITAIKNMEAEMGLEKEALQRVMDGSSRAMVMTDQEGTIQLANNKARLLLENEQLSGRGIYEFFEEWKAIYERLTEDELALSGSEWRYQLRNTDDMVNITMSVLKDDHEHTVKIVFYLYKEGPEQIDEGAYNENNSYT